MVAAQIELGLDVIPQSVYGVVAIHGSSDNRCRSADVKPGLPQAPTE
jgi:hypothetical protein